jgi:glycerophosphoryl diester phosphodiesterase
MAAALGAPAVEFDVHASKDGELVVIHDATLNRTTSGRGRVAKSTLQELQTLDAGAWFRKDFNDETIPTLGEALHAAGPDMVACIEIKSRTVDLKKVEYALLENAKMDSAVVFSFLTKQVLASKRTMPEVPALLLVDLEPFQSYSSSALIELARESGADLLGLHHRGVTPAIVAEIHAHNLPVFVYTVDADSDVERMVRAGVDGIISNRPRATLSRVYRHRPRSKETESGEQ